MKKLRGKIEDSLEIEMSLFRNCSPKWISACEIIHADSFLGAEATYSLFNVEKDTTTVGGEDKQRLIVYTFYSNLPL